MRWNRFVPQARIVCLLRRVVILFLSATLNSVANATVLLERAASHTLSLGLSAHRNEFKQLWHANMIDVLEQLIGMGGFVIKSATNPITVQNQSRETVAAGKGIGPWKLN